MTYATHISKYQESHDAVKIIHNLKQNDYIKEKVLWVVTTQDLVTLLAWNCWNPVLCLSDKSNSSFKKENQDFRNPKNIHVLISDNFGKMIWNRKMELIWKSNYYNKEIICFWEISHQK